MATVTLYCSANWSNCLKDHVHWSLQRSASYPSQLALSELSEKAWNQIFPTSVTGHVTSEIAKDDWERGCAALVFKQKSTYCPVISLLSPQPEQTVDISRRHRNERRNSILITNHHPNPDLSRLGSASDWSCYRLSYIIPEFWGEFKTLKRKSQEFQGKLTNWRILEQFELSPTCWQHFTSKNVDKTFLFVFQPTQREVSPFISYKHQCVISYIHHLLGGGGGGVIFKIFIGFGGEV